MSDGVWWLRVTLACGSVVAAAAHLPVIPAHLREAPYMGVLFVLLSLACVCLAVAALVTTRAVVPVVAIAVCASAIVGYALTRLVAFPQLADDVGNWLEPLGVVSVLSEAVVVLAAVSILRRGPRASTGPSGRRGGEGGPATAGH